MSLSIPDTVQIVYLDEDLVVVHKPAGMLVHRGMGAPGDEVFLLQTVRDKIGVRVHPLHRVDRPTCGLVAFALDADTTRDVQALWNQGQVAKSYLAIVRGWMPQPEGLKDEPLDDPDTGVVQEAQSKWRVLDSVQTAIPIGPHAGARFSLLELRPLTGRWHQLRRHCVRMAHPIVGDTTHGDRHTNHGLQAKFGWWRLMLWAHTLQFPHPRTGKMLDLVDPGPGIDSFWNVLKSESVLPAE